MQRGSPVRTLALGSALALAVLGSSAGAAAAGSTSRAGATPTNVDISQRPQNESEEAIAVNPTNPKNIVMVSNVDFPQAGMFEGVSFDGGSTWKTSLMGGARDNLGLTCCDPTLAFDDSGVLFMAYLLNAGATVPAAYSKDGGLTFTRIPDIAKPAGSNSNTAKEPGLFRYTDHPTIATIHGADWVVFNANGPAHPSAPAARRLRHPCASPPRHGVP